MILTAVEAGWENLCLVTHNPSSQRYPITLPQSDTGMVADALRPRPREDYTETFVKVEH